MCSKITLSVAVIFILSHPVSLTAQVQPFVVDANTIGLWHFDETTGTVAADSSGNGLHGELINGVTWDAGGKFGGCASFNYSGTEGQRITVADDPLLDANNTFTIDAWIYLLTTHDESFVAAKWNSSGANPMGQFELHVRTDHKLSFVCAHNAQMAFIVSDSAVPLEQWVLISAIFDNGQMALYFNEEQQAYGQAPFTSLTDSEYLYDDLNIGDHRTDAHYPYTFEGKIDEVRISNIARYVITDVERNPENAIPGTFTLSQNYPNPFNPTTMIEYSISRRSDVTLEIYNLLGQKVKTLIDASRAAGAYRVEWDGRDAKGQKVTSGLYFYRLNVGEHVETKKMLLLN